MTDETTIPEAPATPPTESEPVAENPTTATTPSTVPPIEGGSPDGTPEQSSSTISPQTDGTAESIGDQIAGEVEAAVAQVKQEAEAATKTAVAEAVAAVEARLAHGETLAQKVEAALDGAKTGLATLKTSSNANAGGTIVYQAIQAFDAHVSGLTEALDAFKKSTGKN